jgi:D-aminopeptidase
VSRNRARCLPSKAGIQLVRETCKRAVERSGRKELKPYRPAVPATMELEFQRNDYADAMGNNPAFTRTGPRSVRWTARTLKELRIA